MQFHPRPNLTKTLIWSHYSKSSTRPNSTASLNHQILLHVSSCHIRIQIHVVFAKEFPQFTLWCIVTAASQRVITCSQSQINWAVCTLSSIMKVHSTIYIVLKWGVKQVQLLLLLTSVIVIRRLLCCLCPLRIVADLWRWQMSTVGLTGLEAWRYAKHAALFSLVIECRCTCDKPAFHESFYCLLVVKFDNL